MTRTDVTIGNDVVQISLADLESVRRKLYRVYLISPMTDVPKRRQSLTKKVRMQTTAKLLSTSRLPFDLYDPAQHTHLGSGHLPEEVQQKNSLEVVTSDLVVWCRTSTADGAGVEFELAVKSKIPVFIIAPEKVQISRMILRRCEHFQPLRFQSLADLRRRLDERMIEIATTTIAQAAKRRRWLGDDWAGQFRRIIIKARLSQNLSRKVLAKKSQLNEHHLQSVEECDEVAASLSQLESNAIMTALGTRFPLVAGKGFVPPKGARNEFQIHPDLESACSESLNNLADFIVMEKPENDDLLRQLWKDYEEVVREGVAGRTDLAVPVTIERWGHLYDQSNGRRLF